MSQWDFGGPPAGQGHQYDEYGEYQGYADTGTSDEFEGGDFSPISYERDPYPPDLAVPAAAAEPWAGQWAQAPDASPPHVSPPPASPPRATPPWPDESWPPRLPRPSRRPRWLIPGAVIAAVAATAGAAIVALSGGHPASPPVAAPSNPPSSTAQPAAAPGTGTGAGTGQQPLTVAQARQVLASYTTANNKANARMSDSRLAKIETGSSYAIDAGIYRVQRAEGTAPYPSFGPRQVRLYIPRDSLAAYPHWFVAQVVNAPLGNPGKATSTEYLVFTQAAPGAPWLNAIEPYVMGRGTPTIAVGADGLAIGLGPGMTALAPGQAQIPQLTAASLDGGQGGPANPGNLADRLDQGFWHQRLPTATVTDRHAAIPDAQVFGLRTADGGALLFYTDAAELTLTPPAGKALHLTIPGFYSPRHALSTAGIGYLEQFATYVPPPGGTGLRVVADYSGITSKNLSRTVPAGSAASPFLRPAVSRRA